MGHKKTFASISKKPMPKLHNHYRANGRIYIASGNSEDHLLNVPTKSVRLVITSPPYNVDKEYEKKKSLDDYLDGLKPIIAEIDRVLVDGGSVCWQIGNYVKDKEVFPLDYYHYELFKQYNYKLRNRIVWHFGHGLHINSRFSGRYEMLLWFTKGDSYVFNLDAVRVPAKYPGKRHHKGDKKGMPSGNPNGKNPSDVWEIIAQEWQDGFWDIPNVKSNHAEKTEHPCQFPIEIAERCILALSHKNDWILDPFAGVGSSLLAGLIHDRRVIGFEKEQKYCDTAVERIKALFLGILPYRPMGTPVYQPTGLEKVAKLPEEWLENDVSLTNGNTPTETPEDLNDNPSGLSILVPNVANNHHQLSVNGHAINGDIKN